MLVLPWRTWLCWRTGEVLHLSTSSRGPLCRQMFQGHMLTWRLLGPWWKHIRKRCESKSAVISSWLKLQWVGRGHCGAGGVRSASPAPGPPPDGGACPLLPAQSPLLDLAACSAASLGYHLAGLVLERRQQGKTKSVSRAGFAGTILDLVPFQCWRSYSAKAVLNLQEFSSQLLDTTTIKNLKLY